METPSSASDGNERINNRRKKKSRQGCKNCKLRAVKCDEGKPNCQRCAAYGVRCSYSLDNTELQLSFETVNTLVVNKSLPVFTSRDDEMFSKFQNRTALTVSTGERLRLLQTDVIDLSRKFPFLRHTILALTLMHDGMLMDRTARADEAYHMYKAVTGFQRVLTRPLGDEEVVAALHTSYMLGNASIAGIDATTPEECWPLAPSSPEDLSWIMMCLGKMRIPEVKSIHDPNPVVATALELHVPLIFAAPRPGPKLQTLPIEFARLFDLDCPCPAIKGLETAIEQTNVIPVIIRFMILVSRLPPGCHQRLKEKDPFALIVILWWYAKIVQMPLWWARRRALLEGKAICIYLAREWEFDGDIQALLRWPRSVFWNSQLPQLV